MTIFSLSAIRFLTTYQTFAPRIFRGYFNFFAKLLNKELQQRAFYDNDHKFIFTKKIERKCSIILSRSIHNYKRSANCTTWEHITGSAVFEIFRCQLLLFLFIFIVYFFYYRNNNARHFQDSFTVAVGHRVEKLTGGRSIRTRYLQVKTSR